MKHDSSNINNVVEIFCDGASRGNPGPASIGVVAYLGDKIVFEISETIGNATNNVAEWTALYRGFQKAVEEEYQSLHFFLDSELVVKQMKGEYKIKKPELQSIKIKIDPLLELVQFVKFQHIPREKNKHADRLANAALDGTKS
jgi:ribonuclease HI